MKVFSMKSFCVKKPSFAKTEVSSLKMSELEIFLWLTMLTQAPNTSMQISRKNKGATKKASTKMVHNKVFLKLFSKKGNFLHKKWWHHQNKL